SDEEELLGIFRKLAASVSDRLQRKEVMALKLFIMIRYADWKTITRSTTLRNPIDQKNDILKEAEHLFFKHWNKNPVRLL
ncbi:hypothetical protein NL466_30245, partial [Klebsiella pneumoniae]|nr:hypothetical protein [Klebsiella pneumoniae]